MASLVDEVKSLKGALYLDTETDALNNPRRGETVSQVGIADSTGKVRSMNLTDANYDTPFLQKHVIDDLKNNYYTDSTLKEKAFSLDPREVNGSKIIELKNARHRLRPNDPINNMTQEFIPRADMVKEVQDIVMNKRNNNGLVVIHNTGFETRAFLTHHFGSNLTHSKQYRNIQSQNAASAMIDRERYRQGKITKEQFFQGEIQRQKRTWNRLKQDIADVESGKLARTLVNSQEIFKTVSAFAQDKGLTLKSGSIVSGSSLDYASNLFFSRKELHGAAMDALDTKRLTPFMMNFAKKLEAYDNNLYSKEDLFAGRVPGVKLSQLEKKYLTAMNDKNNVQKILIESRVRMIQNELEVNKSLHGLSSKIAIESVDDIGMSVSEINRRAMMQAMQSRPHMEIYEKSLSITSPSKSLSKMASNTSRGLLVLGGIAIGGLAAGLTFSGRDDAKVNPEGLKHGWFGDRRTEVTDFGSGFRTDEFHKLASSGDAQDPIPASTAAMLTLGTGVFGLSMAWNQKTGMRLGNFRHLGDSYIELMGAERNATVGEVITNFVKRAEKSLGGFPKVFGVGEQLTTTLLGTAEKVAFDLMQSNDGTLAKILHESIGRNIAKEGYRYVEIRGDKLFVSKNGEEFSQIPGYFRAINTRHDKNVVDSISQTTQGLMNETGSGKRFAKTSDYLIIGAKNAEDFNAKRFMGYMNETVVKALKVMDEPIKAIEEIIPDLGENSVFTKLKKVASKVPGFGTGGDYNGNTVELLKKHGLRLSGMAAALYFGLGTIDWGVKQVLPESTSGGQAGLAGLGADALRVAHMTYASVSDATGLTALRDTIEEMAPGTNGWQTALGFGFVGATAGAVINSIGAVSKEVSAISDGKSYEAFLENQKKTKFDFKLREGLNLGDIPGFKGEYTPVGKGIRAGGIIGLALALPFVIAGLGADESASELKKEYAGDKEVAVRAGRYWEASMTPWEGGKIEYYRPNWYARLMDDAKEKAVYGDQDISPLGKTIRSILDPYWVEKRNYQDSPYAFTGPEGSGLGVFGPLYEATLGRVLRPPAYINKDKFKEDYITEEEKYPVNEELGGLPNIDPRDPSSPFSLLRKQIFTATEAGGLRASMLSAWTKDITGEKNIDSYSPEYESASKINSLTRDFYDLSIGGGLLTSEGIRRAIPREEVGETSYVNPMQNSMPTWLPGEDYYINFQRGDAYSKVKEGYYRLPGEGYATRYKQLEGLDPEKYPDIFKYKILADVAPDSMELKQIRGRLQNRDLTEYEQNIFQQTEQQLTEKASSYEKFRDPRMYDSLLGNYTALLTDVARANPLEQLIPFSPAHKFLPGADPLSRYEETVYAKDFKSWGSPVKDFILPAANTAANIFGIAEIREDVQQVRQVEEYFDQMSYHKNMRLAEDAKARGDMSAMDMFRREADKTMSGLDPYADSNEILRRIPKRERAFFQEFINAPSKDRERILELAPHAMKDVYRAQWEKKDGMAADGEVAEMVRARRKSNVMAAQKGMPGRDWIGWNQGVDLEDVKMKYVINEGQDYHNYGLWKDRLNSLARKPYISAAAENVSAQPRNDYNEHIRETYTYAATRGIKNTRIEVLPSISSGYNVEVAVDRRNERNEKLRNMGIIQ